MTSVSTPISWRRPDETRNPDGREPQPPERERPGGRRQHRGDRPVDEHGSEADGERSPAVVEEERDDRLDRSEPVGRRGTREATIAAP